MQFDNFRVETSNFRRESGHQSGTHSPKHFMVNVCVFFCASDWLRASFGPVTGQNRREKSSKRARFDVCAAHFRRKKAHSCIANLQDCVGHTCASCAATPADCAQSLRSLGAENAAKTLQNRMQFDNFRVETAHFRREGPSKRQKLTEILFDKRVRL